MNIRDSAKLMQIYAACPKCGCEVIGNGKGTLEADTSIGYFKRTCHCGWFVEVKEGVQEVPERVLQALDLLDEEAEEPLAAEAPAPAADEPPKAVEKTLLAEPELPISPPEKEEKTVMIHEPRLWNGFVHIRCDHCGKETTTCLHQPISTFTCRECNHSMELPKETHAFVRCECGFHGRYSTNIPDWKMDIPCANCGMPNTMGYRPGKDVYVPIDQVGGKRPKKLKKK